MKNDSSKNTRGLVITYFGDGKGKTTAALGLALRASGYRKKVAIIQFIKGDWPSGEEKAIKKIETIKITKCGLGFVGIQNDKLELAKHKKAAQTGLDLARKVIKQGNDEIVILDEILGAIKGNLIREKDVLDLIEEKPNNLTLVLTGAPEIKKINNSSDLVTQMKKIKHPYDNGVEAIMGIDY